jgi:hypothetical protein
MLRSLEMNWIRNKIDKSISLPPIETASMEDCGAKMIYPIDMEYFTYGKYYDLSKGLILISDIFDSDDKDIANSIAHEFRHYWQYLNGWEVGMGKKFSQDIEYDNAIVKYFSESYIEWDALTFSHKYAPSDLSTSWLDLLHK